MNAAQYRADHDELLTEAQAADFLKLSIRTLQAWRIRPAGPSFVRAGRAIRYQRCELIAWVDANTVLCRPKAADGPSSATPFQQIHLAGSLDR
jgi:hypothetical protein